MNTKRSIFARFISTFCGGILLLLHSHCLANYLQIHHIGVGQGDATLIVLGVDDVAPGSPQIRILIDAGNSSSKGTEVFNYLNALYGAEATPYLNYIITSHLHSDHYGGTPQLMRLMKANNWGIAYIIDRGAGFSDPSLPSHPDVLCYSDDEGITSNDPTAAVLAEPGSNLYKDYLKVIKDNGWEAKRQGISMGYNLVVPFIYNEHYQSFDVNCMAQSSCVLNQYGTVNFACSPAQSENDMSYVWKVQFDGFRYFSGGDIGGGGGGYQDLETPLCTYFATFPNAGSFHFCALKANHHGSGHSMNANFLAPGCANPTLTVVPSALRSFSGTQIPTRNTLEALATSGSQLYYTYIKANGIYYEGSVEKYNHVVLNVKDPGFGNNIPIAVTQCKVNKETLANEDQWGAGTVTCTKAHPAPTMSVSKTDAQGGLASTNPLLHGSLVQKAQKLEMLLQMETPPARRVRRIHGSYIQGLDTATIPTFVPLHDHR